MSRTKLISYLVLFIIHCRYMSIMHAGCRGRGRRSGSSLIQSPIEVGQRSGSSFPYLSNLKSIIIVAWLPKSPQSSSSLDLRKHC